jgi:hypothetical protein
MASYVSSSMLASAQSQLCSPCWGSLLSVCLSCILRMPGRISLQALGISDFSDSRVDTPVVALVATGLLVLVSFCSAHSSALHVCIAQSKNPLLWWRRRCSFGLNTPVVLPAGSNQAFVLLSARTMILCAQNLHYNGGGGDSLPLAPPDILGAQLK